MGYSFNSGGSMVNNPQQGLLGNSNFQQPGLQNPSQGFLPQAGNAISNFMSGQNRNTPITGNADQARTGAPQPPTPPQPTTAVKSTTDSQGNTTTYHAPTTVAPDDPANKYNTTTGLLNTNYKDPNASSTSSNTSGSTIGGTSTTPASTNPQVGTTTQNYQNVLDQSNLNNNPEYQNLLQQQNQIIRGQNDIALAGPGQINPVGNQLGAGYSGLFGPQSQASLQGEKGILNSALSSAEAGNAAEAQRLISGAQLATQGASTVAGASNLYPTSQGQASFSALGGYQDGGNYFGDPSDPQTAVNKTAFDSLGSQTTQLQADLNGFTANSNLVANTIAKAGTNSGNVPYLTALNQMVQRGIASPADLASFQAMITQLQQEGVTISPDLSLDAIKKELDGQIALKQNTITGNQNQMAKLKSGGSSGSSTGGSTSGFGWNG